MITYVVGDATLPPTRPAIVAHVCNDAGLWGAGFVVAVSRRWPQPEAAYRRWHRSGPLPLGALQLVEVGEGLWVANLIGQRGVRRTGGKPPVRYGAVREALGTLAGEARQLGAAVHMPRIGCGLAGGTWSQIAPIVVETLDGVAVTVYDLPRCGPTVRGPA